MAQTSHTHDTGTSSQVGDGTISASQLGFIGFILKTSIVFVYFYLVQSFLVKEKRSHLQPNSEKLRVEILFTFSTLNNTHFSVLRPLSWLLLSRKSRAKVLRSKPEQQTQGNSFVCLYFLMLHKEKLWIAQNSEKNHGGYFLRFQSQWGI